MFGKKKKSNPLVKCGIDELTAKGIRVLEVIELDDYEPVFVISKQDLGMLVDNWCDNDDGKIVNGPLPGDELLICRAIAEDGSVYYEDITPPDCYVQSSETLLGILSDCWQTDFWNAEESIALVDEYVKSHKIKDIVKNFEKVMKAIEKEEFE